MSEFTWFSLFQTFLFGTFALLALFLASVGVFGLMSYRIAARTAEIGVLRALGAQDRQILILVVRQGLALTGAGLLLGLLGAFLTGSWVRSLLYNVEPTDPTTIAVLSLVLAVTAMGASLHPARRALGIPPLRALRGDDSRN